MMKIAHWALSTLLLVSTTGVAMAQTKAACPPPPDFAQFTKGLGAKAAKTGNITSLFPELNADTDLPKDSPLAGLPNPFKTEFDWAKMPKGRVWGDARAIALDKDGSSVWVADRCGLNEGICGKDKTINPVMKFDRNGNLVKAFGAGMFQSPHGIFVDKDGNIWTTDGGPQDGCQPAGQPAGNKLREWSPDGKLLMTISGPVNGKPFTGLNDVVVSPVTGDIFLADGHGGYGTPSNNRIIRFDKTGKFILEWGKPGDGDNEIGIPHALAMDKEGRIYVADRSSTAVKVYDQTGKLLHVWHQFGQPSGVTVDKNDLLYVVDETANIPGVMKAGPVTLTNPKLSPGVRIAKLDGKIIANVPYRPGNTLEGIAVDDAGNIYGANTNHPRAVRFMQTGPLPPH
jgi:DNA-binding beta-propeller fold protein YncE